MSSKTVKIIIVVLILLALGGVALIVVPPLLQDAQLNKDAEGYEDLLNRVTVKGTEIPHREDPTDTLTPTATETITATPTMTVTPTATAEITSTPEMESTEEPTDVPEETETANTNNGNGFVSSNASETTNTSETKHPEETTATPDQQSDLAGWNPFGEKQQTTGLGLFGNTENEQEEKDDSNWNGIRYGKYSNDTSNISPVDNPDDYNAWLVEKLKTPTPTPVPTPTPPPTPTIPPTPTPSPTPTPTPAPRIGAYTGVNLDECKALNSDFIAWIKIPSTNLDYPVVQSNNTDYYLEHTFDGKKSKLGTLISLGKCNWKSPSRNIVIYGHDVEGSGNKMFKMLLKYKDKTYYNEHPYIYLDSMYEDGKYQIFACFDITVGDMDPSRTSFASTNEFLDFVGFAQEISLYDTGVTVSGSDHIITLVTCDRYFKVGVGRFIVMAKKV